MIRRDLLETTAKTIAVHLITGKFTTACLVAIIFLPSDAFYYLLYICQVSRCRNMFWFSICAFVFRQHRYPLDPNYGGYSMTGYVHSPILILIFLGTFTRVCLLLDVGDLMWVTPLFYVAYRFVRGICCSSDRDAPQARVEEGAWVE